LKNALVNLISNAIKYSGEDTLIEFTTCIDDEGCLISVKDNGIGIPEEDQVHLFEPFFRAHNTGNIPGTGLGLNIVKRYIELMAGQMEFESEVHKGTSFRVSFK
jgi:signal transduction histidine kinase